MRNLVFAIMVGLCLQLLQACGDSRSSATSVSRSQNEQTIQVGWMTSWATTAQIMQAMMHTNIAQLCSVPLTFKSFLFGPDINEAALHGEVDCINSGLVPTISLLAASPDWVVIGRLIDSPLTIVARKGSNVRTLDDLKGKSLAVPFGGGSHPYALKRLKESGLAIGDHQGEVRLVNLKPSEQMMALAQGKVDAVGTWEPQTALVVCKGLGVPIDWERHLGVITVRKSIAEKHPQEVVKLLEAYARANFYVATHREQTDKWYADTAHLDEAVLPNIRTIEPNAKAQNFSQINLNLSSADLALAQQYADIMFEAGLIPQRLNFKERTDLSFLERATTELKSQTQAELAKIEVNP